ncbi:MAG: putative collagen-binding domain-containing protein, partial [Clostridiales bacterium]|nr:putative collagen-binding domain-containing protein [Clostridiales bacterium]
IGAHNVTIKEPFKDYHKNNKEIDILLYQAWGDTSSDKAIQLASGLEEDLKKNIYGSGKVNILAEYGYEGDPDTGLSKPPHDVILGGHTRRGACKALFMGMHFVAGFENTWGPYFRVAPDPKGASLIINIKKLFTEIIKFNECAPRFDLLDEIFETNTEQSSKILCISNIKEDTVLIYLPEGGEASLNISHPDIKKACLFDTITGEMKETKEYEERAGKTVVFTPKESDDEGYDKDWIIIIYK